jgi:nitrogen regulatory protein PII
MEMIEAVIRPNRLDAVKAALAELGVQGATAMECKGFGRQMGHTERYRGGRLEVGFVPKILLQVCVRPRDVKPAVDAIVNAARSGKAGDGKIFVYPVATTVRIRTGERNEAAL